MAPSSDPYGDYIEHLDYYYYEILTTDNFDFTLSHPPGERTVFQVYAAAFCTLIFCISLPGNSFLLWVLLKERAWRTTHDIFLLQLAVSNLCSTTTLPFMASNALNSWVFGWTACGAVRGFFFLGMNSYPIIVTAMVLHSYITVVHASRVSAQAFSKRRVLVGSIVMWLPCAAVSIRDSMDSVAIPLGEDEMCTGVESAYSMTVSVSLGMTLFFLLPLAIITFCYVHLWITIRQGRINRQDQPSKLILGITVGYFLCVALHHITLLMNSLYLVNIFRSTAYLTHTVHCLMFISYPLTHFYCLLYPLFYIPGAQRFRRHLPQRCQRNRDDSSVALVNLLETCEDEDMIVCHALTSRTS
ncbi:chemokine XC receptor 1-like [Stegastes partitus]|uniref:Chemokine XC receptor 1-like n=1 Tax=Stegastes partitus TaxID=144197 RepID=A0A3B5AJN5_9TELE|nr:PREDICTED: chemokine XC receptor 1-like [Stegastes partitus]